MRNIVILVSSLLFVGGDASAACPDYLNNEMRILGTTDVVNFCEAYGEKPLLIVNTASNCGYTHQFSGLEKLHQLYRDRGLVVLGSPVMISSKRKITRRTPLKFVLENTKFHFP